MAAGAVGLCTACRWARPVRSAKGATFWRCGLSERDPSFPKYPRLPVWECPGFESGSTPPAEDDQGHQR